MPQLSALAAAFTEFFPDDDKYLDGDAVFGQLSARDDTRLLCRQSGQ